MLQMDEGLRLRADPAFPWTPSTLGACAQRFGACLGRAFEVCNMFWPDCRKLPCTESCRVGNRLLLTQTQKRSRKRRAREMRIHEVGGVSAKHAALATHQPAWPSRFGEPTQELTESAPDGGTASKDGSPHLSRRHAARRTATVTETKPLAPRGFMDGSLACAGPMELLMQ